MEFVGCGISDRVSSATCSGEEHCALHSAMPTHTHTHTHT